MESDTLSHPPHLPFSLQLPLSLPHLPLFYPTSPSLPHLPMLSSHLAQEELKQEWVMHVSVGHVIIEPAARFCRHCAVVKENTSINSIFSDLCINRKDCYPLWHLKLLYPCYVFQREKYCSGNKWINIAMNCWLHLPDFWNLFYHFEMNF